MAPRVTGRGLAAFLVVSYGLAWLACLPLWLGPGLAQTSTLVFTALGVLMMYTPTVGAVIACKLDRLPVRATLGLGLGPRPGRTVLTAVVVVALVALVAVLGLITSALAGTYGFDLVHLSGARSLLEAQLAAAGQQLPDLPLTLLVPLMIVQAFTLGTLISSLAALGEEIGWRGYLMPLLTQRLGAPLATVAVGIVWGVWHAPLLLLGYNYPTLPGWQRLVWMSVFCTILAAVLGWGRARSGSVVPAAVGHGAVNAGAATLAILVSDAPSFDTSSATIMGWAGWPAALVAAAILVTVAWPRTPADRRVMAPTGG